MLPSMSVAIRIPSRSPLRATVRKHNQFTKEAVRETLFRHWLERSPDHFKQTAMAKYGYKPRSEKYLRSKRRKFGFRADNPLLYTGKSRDYITRTFSITVGGAAEGGKKEIGAKLTTRFQWRGGSGKMREGGRSGVTPQDMVNEMTRTTPEEREKMSQNILKRYLAKLHGRG